jgi:hypothetical protein
MPTLNTRSWRGSSETPISASTSASADRRRARACELVEALAHGGHRATSATTTCGLSPVVLSARSSAWWSRPSTRAVLQPSSSKRAAIPRASGRSRSGYRPSTAMRRRARAGRRAARPPSCCPRRARRRPTEQTTRAPSCRRASTASACRPRSAGRAPSEPLEISTPGRARGRGGSPAGVDGAEAGEALAVHEALRGQDGVVGGGAVALGEQEAVALGIVGGRGSTRRTRS